MSEKKYSLVIVIASVFQLIVIMAIMGSGLGEIWQNWTLVLVTIAQSLLLVYCRARGNGNGKAIKWWHCLYWILLSIPAGFLAVYGSLSEIVQVAISVVNLLVFSELNLVIWKIILFKKQRDEDEGEEEELQLEEIPEAQPLYPEGYNEEDFV